jgi:hypothetical protein
MKPNNKGFEPLSVEISMQWTGIANIVDSWAHWPSVDLQHLQGDTWIPIHLGSMTAAQLKVRFLLKMADLTSDWRFRMTYQPSYLPIAPSQTRYNLVENTKPGWKPTMTRDLNPQGVWIVVPNRSSTCRDCFCTAYSWLTTENRKTHREFSIQHYIVPVVMPSLVNHVENQLVLCF